MTTHNWEIRRAHENDLAEVILLERETATAPHWSAAQYAGLLGSESGTRRCLYVARQAYGLGGFAIASLIGSPPDAEAELESVVVANDLRRQGLGSALCRAVMEWSHREGAAAITLEVRAASPWALRLYGGLGFVAIGRRPGYYRDPADDAIVMRCALYGALGASPAAGDV